jgi:hypothetical protein
MSLSESRAWTYNIMVQWILDIVSVKAVAMSMKKH